MFDIQPMELVVLGAVAILVIPPKDLPKAMRVAGHWIGRARGVARQFRSGFDAIVRESELAELQKQWAEENARIMAEHPMPAIAQLEPEPSVVDHAPLMVEPPQIHDAVAIEASEAPAKPTLAKPKRKPRSKATTSE